MKKLLYSILLLSFISLNTFSKNSKDPNVSKVYVNDIQNFYLAFDEALKDTLNAKHIFKELYFNKGSKGLKDFYKTKIKSVDKFSKFVLKHKEFYLSIRSDLTNLDDLKKEIKTYFLEFKSLYPNATFPDIYFVIGRFSSNGTISKNGIIIGTEILCKTPNSNTKNWNKDILRISMLRKHIPVTVIHELIHFNQKHMKKGNTILVNSMREGSAEFIAELICGETDEDYSSFIGKEVEVWNDFKNQKDEKSTWISWNSWVRKSESRPRNAGYWSGYLLCKSYYEQNEFEKQKVIDDILNIKNYDDFYFRSKIEEYIKVNYSN
ncbi:gliding motility protein GldB-related protein [Flammeovirga kamogawensis]|uniref:DUF2268 domain-containing protein n=1 Tax=Flammeovirga kamogawensis TaxID=373891 RepID=A0ABX8H305_9BACT|nr:DUF2268 domain-containing putative Zn-dependent protease [Flammeovirga kamogawensis]MBB6460133.1 hypothetical protein [Flammeovirga kamogawensis]QWG09947.1 DUF2268 domain-containing protein [Flammeovirga kamogawensis]TRX65455.1 hypothetical protein EO216_23325 [Flammeovirga kamogawensis]